MVDDRKKFNLTKKANTASRYTEEKEEEEEISLIGSK